jgi:hypothetical protein
MKQPPAGTTLASMSNFTDWLTVFGLGRVTLVRDHKRRASDPYADYYGPLRDRMVDALRRGQPTDGLAAFVDGQVDDSMRRNFREVLAGWDKFLASHQVAWFEPPSFDWPVGPGLAIRLNPEFGLVVDGEPHVVKLYARADKLTQKRADLMVAMLQMVEVPGSSKPVRLAVLDGRNGRLVHLGAGASKPTAQRKIQVLLRAEAAGYAVAYGMV